MKLYKKLLKRIEDGDPIYCNETFAKDLEAVANKHFGQLAIHRVVSSAFLVQHKETLINYGLFSTRKKAENYIDNNTDLFGIQEVKIA